MKKIIILSLGLLLLAAACNKSNPVVDSSQDQTVTPTPTPTPAPDPTEAPPPAPAPTPAPASVATSATIKITAKGFEPANVTVKKGSIVTFVNSDSGLHWVASDPHPTHTDLPGFDAKKGLKLGESYSFTFDKLGRWKFHDHLNPSSKGQVTVVE